jgi:hypothetical protein
MTMSDTTRRHDDTTNDRTDDETNTQPSTRLVCRCHHDQAVNFRGKGCVPCAKALQTWRDRRRRRTTTSDETWTT